MSENFGDNYNLIRLDPRTKFFWCGAESITLIWKVRSLSKLIYFIVETAAGQRKRRQRLQIQVAEKGYEVDRQKFTWRGLQTDCRPSKSSDLPLSYYLKQDLMTRSFRFWTVLMNKNEAICWKQICSILWMWPRSERWWRSSIEYVIIEHVCCAIVLISSIGWWRSIVQRRSDKGHETHLQRAKRIAKQNERQKTVRMRILLFGRWLLLTFNIQVAGYFTFVAQLFLRADRVLRLFVQFRSRLELRIVVNRHSSLSSQVPWNFRSHLLVRRFNLFVLSFGYGATLQEVFDSLYMIFFSKN